MNPALTEMTSGELADIRGGNYAYDIGRVIRFLAFSASPNTAASGVVDWAITDMLNSR